MTTPAPETIEREKDKIKAVYVALEDWMKWQSPKVRWIAARVRAGLWA